MAEEKKIICPNCGKPMVLRTRRSDGNPFWGCSGYPVCRKTLDGSVVNGAQASAPKKEFIPSVYQQAIFDYIQDKNGTDAVIEAVAGSGKTTTIVEALKYTSGRVVFCAFNKRIADELRTRAPAHVKCCTLHSLGFAALRNALPHKPEVDDDKKMSIAKELLPADEDFYVRVSLVKVASLVQATLTEPTDVAAVNSIIDRYDIDLNGGGPKVLAALPRMIELCASRTTVIDYDDMCWLVVALNLPMEKFDWVLIDESQDLNVVQQELVLRSVNEYGRIIAVGDRNQSIYGFRGADTEAIPNLIARLNEPKILPLSITYRCPVEHVKLARQFVPQLEAAPNAIAGEVLNITKGQLFERAKDGDLVLCRINAPLVDVCYSLIRQGKKAVIVGRDIGKGLAQLIDKMKARDIHDLLAKLRDYRWAEVAKLEAAGKSNRAAGLSDRIDTITALCDGVGDITTLKAKIDSIFTDDVKGIALSSVHRAKGLESDTIFILEPQLMPFPKAKLPWEAQQEKNIQYVAYTRAKKVLAFVTKDGGGQAMGPLAAAEVVRVEESAGRLTEMEKAESRIVPLDMSDGPVYRLDKELELRGEQAQYTVEEGMRADALDEDEREEDDETIEPVDARQALKLWQDSRIKDADPDYKVYMALGKIPAHILGDMEHFPNGVYCKATLCGRAMIDTDEWSDVTFDVRTNMWPVCEECKKKSEEG